jgi:hypothetical protein
LSPWCATTHACRRLSTSLLLRLLLALVLLLVLLLLLLAVLMVLVSVGMVVSLSMILSGVGCKNLQLSPVRWWASKNTA